MKHLMSSKRYILLVLLLAVLVIALVVFVRPRSLGKAAGLLQEQETLYCMELRTLSTTPDVRTIQDPEALEALSAFLQKMQVRYGGPFGQGYFIRDNQRAYILQATYLTSQGYIKYDPIFIREDGYICIGGDGHYYATDPQQVEQILQLISSYL